MESLPLELRLLVYRQCVNIRALGLLYANKQFHKEFSPFLLKKDFVLGFHIDPSSSTQVKIINPDNSAWGNHCILDAASSHVDHSILDAMPIDQFKGIRILIDPPSTDDPGQVVRGLLQSTALVTALLPRWANPETIPRTEDDIINPVTRSSTRVPPITVQVRQGKTTRWHTEGSWNRTIPYSHDGISVLGSYPDDYKGFSDLQTILTPLARVRNADAIVFKLPLNAPVASSFDYFKNDLVDLADEDALHVWLDYLLDDMHGPAAAELRRDRFKFWCSEYEYQTGRRFYGIFGDPDRFGGARMALNANPFDLVQKGFHDRFMSAREHVLAAWRDTLRRHGHPVYINPEKYIDFWYHSLRVIELGLRPMLGRDETFWEVCYPSGIEPKSQNDNWENTEQADLVHRLEPPLDTTDSTASQILPAETSGCKHCAQGDLEARKDPLPSHEKMWKYLSTFSLRSFEERRLAPIAAT
ncbi:hypothetical protein AYO20_09417 [Fonsecaea nubica]|uniref:Uncharacterized protein n=1 Tax=Fonsecaea nubica TaxID=856822 RepID=A0A178CI31_9EURO|nr:hypothetical protein AYO20_09417 [Fonsecaea nubica]OAL28693.1 hypothetical protein AYO20_09417 [Fonsecaea nubica]